jgi:hypothetical protein
LALADQLQEALSQTKGQSSIGTELQEVLQHTVFGVGALGGTTQPHAGHASWTRWSTDQPPTR